MPRQHAHLSAHPAGLWALYFWLRLGREGKKSEGVREGGIEGAQGAKRQERAKSLRDQGGTKQHLL